MFLDRDVRRRRHETFFTESAPDGHSGIAERVRMQMVEFRLLWKEKIPGLPTMQTFAGVVTTDFAAVHGELVARHNAPGNYSLFIEAREATADPWPAPGEGNIPPLGRSVC